MVDRQLPGSRLDRLSESRRAVEAENGNPWPLRLKIILLGVVTLVMIASGFGAFAQERRYTLDAEHLTVAFMVHHIGFADTLGVFREVEGSFDFDPQALTLSRGEVRVQAASVETFHQARNGHVRGSDFLDAESNPVIAFDLTEAEATGETTGILRGTLTLRGETHPISLDVTLNKVGEYPFGHRRETVGISARGVIERSQWGMDYALGGIVGDEVTLIIEAEAILDE